MTQFTAASDDGQVVATVSARLEVLRVRVADGCPCDVAERGIVQAVNRALEKAESMPVDEIVRARDSRMNQFNAVIEGLEVEVARGRSQARDSRPSR